ncbi:gene 1.4 [Escherichia phage T7]|uniref:Gene 1.4 n=1 Tax=Escherichia phage T7 TaxID=10760 RepID=Q6WYF7_BPT7|nr:gene 1.4 [Escherichia phage T7]AAP34024.1 gene 1.4 [Escherichia phage T7]
MFKKVGKFLAALAAILTLAYILAVYLQVALVVIGACYLATVCACVWSIVNW